LGVLFSVAALGGAANGFATRIADFVAEGFAGGTGASLIVAVAATSVTVADSTTSLPRLGSGVPNDDSIGLLASPPTSTSDVNARMQIKHSTVEPAAIFWPKLKVEPQCGHASWMHVMR
jgi:hypothetical protein